MTRVGWVFEHPTLSGGERSALTLIPRLAPPYEVVALAPPEGPLAGELAARGCAHEPLVLSRRDHPIEALAGTLSDVAARLQLDLLHANGLGVADLTGLAAPPSVAHVREIGRIKGARMARLLGNQRLIAVSEAVARSLIAQGAPADRVAVCHNGIDTDRWRPDRWPPLDRPADRRLLLAVGQLGMRKGFDLLLDAVARIEQPLALWIAGARWSTKQEAVDHEAALRAAADGCGHPVRFLGYRDDVPALLATADLLVHPARQEPLGRVILEAMAMGCPVVATDVGGTAEMLPAGCLVPAEDPAALAAAIRAAPRQRQPALRQRCEARFGVARALSGLLEIYRGLEWVGGGSSMTV